MKKMSSTEIWNSVRNNTANTWRHQNRRPGCFNFVICCCCWLVCFSQKSGFISCLPWPLGMITDSSPHPSSGLQVRKERLTEAGVCSRTIPRLQACRRTSAFPGLVVAVAELRTVRREIWDRTQTGPEGYWEVEQRNSGMSRLDPQVSVSRRGVQCCRWLIPREEEQLWEGRWRPSWMGRAGGACGHPGGGVQCEAQGSGQSWEWSMEPSWWMLLPRAARWEGGAGAAPAFPGVGTEGLWATLRGARSQ